jgi:fructokinase
MTGPIVGIGELLWDVYPDGRKVAGGAPFNFAFHCHQLGHPAAIVSRVGDDELGRELRERVRELGLTDEYIQTDRDHPTGTVRVTLDEQKVPTYTIAEDVAWDHIGWDEVVERLAGECSAVCLGTLAQRVTDSATSIQRFIGTATDGLVVFDVNLRTELTSSLRSLVRDLARRVHWMKLNDEELARLLEATDDDGDLPKRQRESKYVFDASTDIKRVCILTRGQRSTVVTDWQRTEWIPAVPADVVDTVGAGDAFTAAMVCLHLEGRPLRDCARFANHYAARVCEQPGGTPRVDRGQVERAVFG